MRLDSRPERRQVSTFSSRFTQQALVRLLKGRGERFFTRMHPLLAPAAARVTMQTMASFGLEMRAKETRNESKRDLVLPWHRLDYGSFGGAICASKVDLCYV